MTPDGGSTAPYSPSGGPLTPQPGPSARPAPPFGSGGSRRPGGGGVAIALGIVAIVLAVAALIVAIVRGGESSAPTTPTAQPTTSSSPTAADDTTAVDKALCKAIEPLIKESSEQKNAFVALGRTGTPERDGGIPEFVKTTQDWVGRAQRVLDEHAEPPRYITRSLQRYIDDMRMYASGIRPGPATDADTAAWTDSLVALSGPFEVCTDVGVRLW